MKILFLCTAFNSLSQRVALVLRERGHAVTVEMALTPDLMISAAKLAQPDIVICPFLTKRVPPEIYNAYLTLIVHPGPPGDAGPSAIDWCLIGDMGESLNSDDQLMLINAKHAAKGATRTMRSHWGVTVLQAIEALDAGPVWAFDQFELDAETSQFTKSDLYRGPVTRAALNGVLAAIERIQDAAKQQQTLTTQQPYPPHLQAPPKAAVQCVLRGVPFLGGRTHDRPLLKASSRDFFALLDGTQQPTLSAEAIVQRINSADSQPGVLTSLFGTPLFVYSAVVQRAPLPERLAIRAKEGKPGTVLATREGAVLITVGADFPLWICHIRRPKGKADKFLHPKLPAVMGLLTLPQVAESLGLFSAEVEEWSATTGFGVDPVKPWEKRSGTYQQVWVELEKYDGDGMIGYVHSDFYNGAFSTLQCQLLLEAIKWTLSQPALKAIVMLGGSGYFSNGIALNVIEGSSDPAAEGWANINAIDDCVQALLAPTGVLTFSALRGNAAAGGLALATAADIVLSIESAVLNPHYRGLGLFGSEWHTYSWYERCGPEVAAGIARDMLPMSTKEAKRVGLVDHIIDNEGMGSDAVAAEIKSVVRQIMVAKVKQASRGGHLLNIGAPWTKALRSVSGNDEVPLSEQLVKNKVKYLAYMFADRGDGKTLQENFVTYRKQELGQMTFDFFHPYRHERFAKRCTAFVRKLVPTSTPFRFALHRRYDSADWDKLEKQALSDPSNETHEKVEINKDEEELDEFDSLGDIPASAAVARLVQSRPEFVPRLPRVRESLKRTASEQIETSRSHSDRSRTSSPPSSVSTAPTTPRSAVKQVQSICDEEALRTIEEALEHAASTPVPASVAVKKGPSVIAFAAQPSTTSSSQTQTASTSSSTLSSSSSALTASTSTTASVRKSLSLSSSSAKDVKPSTRRYLNNLRPVNVKELASKDVITSSNSNATNFYNHPPSKIQRFFASLRSRRSNKNDLHTLFNDDSHSHVQTPPSSKLLPLSESTTTNKRTSHDINSSQPIGARISKSKSVNGGTTMDLALKSAIRSAATTTTPNATGFTDIESDAEAAAAAAKRRSSISTPFSGISAELEKQTTFSLKENRRRSYLSPSSRNGSVMASSPTIGSVSPRIVEGKDGGNNLWSCYYSETGEPTLQPGSNNQTTTTTNVVVV